MCIVIWTEKIIGQAKAWNFVFPTLSVRGTKTCGMVIQLTHGAVITWPGWLVAHCTSKAEIGKNNNGYGCYFGNCGGGKVARVSPTIIYKLTCIELIY